MSEQLTLSNDDKVKIKALIDYGVDATTRINAIKEELKEEVKAVAKDLSIKPALLNKAIRVANKSSVTALQGEVDTMEELLHAAGRA